MTKTSPNPNPDRSRRWRAWFGRRELAALVLAVALAVAAIRWSDSLREVDNLGYGGAFLVMLVSSATLVFPAPGMLIVFAIGGVVGSPLLLGIVSGLGAALGELTGYLAGLSGSRAITNWRLYRRFHNQIETRGGWAIAVLAFVPNPVFDLAGVAAGALGMSWRKFLMAAASGKILRFIIIAYGGRYSIGWLESLL